MYLIPFIGQYHLDIWAKMSKIFTTKFSSRHTGLTSMIQDGKIILLKRLKDNM